MDHEDSRWACPKCGSKDVEIALPLWCKEDTSGDLAPGHMRAPDSTANVFTVLNKDGDETIVDLMEEQQP